MKKYWSRSKRPFVKINVLKCDRDVQPYGSFIWHINQLKLLKCKRSAFRPYMVGSIDGGAAV
jgi:hypothetical protein